MEIKDFNWQKDRVMVEPINPAEEHSGLALPENVAQSLLSDTYMKAKVISVGETVTRVKPGDMILIYGGRADGDIKIDNKLYFVIREEMIPCKLPAPVAKKEKPKDKPSSLILN